MNWLECGALEHLVDATFILDGNADDNFRMLFARKNRFGDTGETGFFQMTETGLLSVEKSIRILCNRTNSTCSWYFLDSFKRRHSSFSGRD